MDILERAKMLLEITERASLHSGKFTAITGAAMDELLRINEELRQDAMAKAAEVKAKEDAERVVQVEDEQTDDIHDLFEKAKFAVKTETPSRRL